MNRHTLLLRFAAETAPKERDAFLQSLIGLCDRVGAVSSVACGPDVDPRTRAEGFTLAFSVVFGDAETRTAFQALPDYAATLRRLSQAAGTVRVAD